MIKNINLRTSCSEKDTTKKDAVRQFPVKLNIAISYVENKNKKKRFGITDCFISLPTTLLYFHSPNLNCNSHLLISQLNDLTRVPTYRTPEQKPFIFPFH